MNVEHPISVVICARDEAENLANFLPGVLVQQYSTTHEIVLVNDTTAIVAPIIDTNAVAVDTNKVKEIEKVVE